MNALIEDLTWRGLIADSTDLDALSAHLDEGPITSYVGFDPTAGSLHIGHLVQLIVARRIQQAGHSPLLLVGGSTGLIGDPKQTGERVMNSPEVVAEWVDRLRAQVTRYVNTDGPNAARVVNNLDWTKDISALELLRDVGKHFSVNRMLARDVVARRLETGISFSEFSYVLLQSLDYHELYRRYGCTLQTGAQDQWGNIAAGADYVRRREGVSVHGLVTPLLTKADGTKFGKTESGTVWIDPGLTSPYAFHQFWLNSEDSKVGDYLKIFSHRSREEIAELEVKTAEAPHQRAAQRALADDVTDLVHGSAERQAAVAAAQALFGRGEVAGLSQSTMRALASDVGGGELQIAAAWPSIVDVMVAAGVVDSKAAARRAIAEGGAYINNVKVDDVDATLSEEQLLHGRWVLARRGRKTTGVATISR